MKKEIRNISELTKAKELLERVEGGTLGHRLPDFEMPIDSLPSCNFFQCNVPMYGSITQPGWRLKK